jgi:class 3 adenylate cyclase
MPPQINDPLLEARLEELEKRRSWVPRLVSKLETFIRTAEDDALFRVNPFTFARERNIAEQDAMDVLLHATALGIFSLDWTLFCPFCCAVVESFRSLSGIRNTYRCSLCQIQHETALDDYIAVTFTINSEIREIALHRPEKLSPWDRYFKSGNTPDGILPDGTPLRVAKASIAKLVCDVPAQGTTRVDIETAAGTLIAASVQGKAALKLTVAGEEAAAGHTIPVRWSAAEVTAYTTAEIAPGKLTFDIRNDTPEAGMFVAVLLPPGVQLGGLPLRFQPFLNSKQLLTSQTFRDLFRSEVIQASDGIAVRDLALLFTDLKGSTELYDRIGDLNAFSLVQRHFERLQQVIARHRGVMVKTIGDAVMAAFMNAADAMAAALEMLGDGSNDAAAGDHRDMVLKVGVHRGAAIAVTMNQTVDYFGQTVNIASRIQNLAEANEIYLSEDVYDAPDVQPLLERIGVEPSLAKLRGVNEGMRVFRIACGRAKP